MLSSSQCTAPVQDTRYERNELEDLKIAIDALAVFKAELEKLHPNVKYVMERLLQYR